MEITKSMYLLAKKIVAEYEEKNINKCKDVPKAKLFFRDQNGNLYDNNLKPIQEEFSDQVIWCYNECIKYFDSHLLPLKVSEGKKWHETIDKLNRIDGIPFDKIVEIVQWARNDSFWSKNFLSLRKLRTKDKNGVKYAVVFNEKLKDKKPLTLAQQMRKEHNL